MFPPTAAKELREVGLTRETRGVQGVFIAHRIRGTRHVQDTQPPEPRRRSSKAKGRWTGRS